MMLVDPVFTFWCYCILCWDPWLQVTEFWLWLPQARRQPRRTVGLQLQAQRIWALKQGGQESVSSSLGPICLWVGIILKQDLFTWKQDVGPRAGSPGLPPEGLPEPGPSPWPLQLLWHTRPHAWFCRLGRLAPTTWVGWGDVVPQKKWRCCY